MPRLKMDVSLELAGFLRDIAHKHRISVDEVVARAIVGLALIRAMRKRGLMHVGFVADPRKLDAELRGLLPEQPHVIVHA